MGSRTECNAPYNLLVFRFSRNTCNTRILRFFVNIHFYKTELYLLKYRFEQPFRPYIVRMYLRVTRPSINFFYETNDCRARTLNETRLRCIVSISITSPKRIHTLATKRPPKEKDNILARRILNIAALFLSKRRGAEKRRTKWKQTPVERLVFPRFQEDSFQDARSGVTER